MYKKSITRIEKENESSQAELSNPALHDIIATNHVVLVKKPREERLSRACKAVILMIILGLIAIGIIVLTVVLAHSRNALMAVVSRSIDGNFSQISNNTRLLFVDQENLTKITNEPRENENWQTMTVGLTSYNLPTLTTANVHISSSIMSTEQQNEYTSRHTSSMKSYPSTNTIANEQTTVLTTIQITTATATTISNQPTTDVPSSHLSTAIMLTEEGLTTTTKSQEYHLTSANTPETSVVDSTSPLIPETTNPTPEATSFTTFISRHFNIQSSTIRPNGDTRSTDFMDKFRARLEEDVLDDLLFS